MAEPKVFPTPALNPLEPIVRAFEVLGEKLLLTERDLVDALARNASLETQVEALRGPAAEEAPAPTPTS